MKYGRLARQVPGILPHYSSLVAARRQLAMPPGNFTSLSKVPTSDVGMMLNDSLGCCTCAGYYHARQVWSANTQTTMVTEPDRDVEELYGEVGGYVPGNPSTDNGADEQSVLSYLMKTGAPIGTAGLRHKLTAAYEIDPRNLNDVKWAITECGLVYIGFDVPAFMDSLEKIGSVWDVNHAGNNAIQGGHCVIVPGWLADGRLQVISWGSTQYTMTPAFWMEFVDECYGLVDTEYQLATGKNPAGLSLPQWEQFMQPISRGVVTTAQTVRKDQLQWNISATVQNALGQPSINLDVGVTF